MDNEILHYKRGLTFIERMKKELSWDKYSKESVCEFYGWCLEKFCEGAKLSLFDMQNFMVLCTIALMGLNKESVENNDNLKDYKYTLPYPWPPDVEKEVPVYFKKKINDGFYKKRVIATPYDEWLSVTKYKPAANLTPNYLYCVRNGFMHSEYNIDLSDQEYNFRFLNVRNSNYTEFEGVILICNFLEFIKFFYSNDAYFGLVDRYFMGACEDEKFKIKDYAELHKVSQVEPVEIKYKNCKADKNKTFEKKNYGQMKIPNIPGYAVTEESIAFSNEQDEKVKLFIHKYYGDAFYDFDGLKQGRIIFMIKKYMLSPSSYISEWIIHFYLNTVHVMHRDGQLDNPFTGIFALDAVFVIFKSYLILYRLQNKRFEEIDYLLINDFEYEYAEAAGYDMYEAFKNKLIGKGIGCTEKEYKQRYFCEVFRNAMAHGNLEVDMEESDKGEAIHKLIFKDIYHGKTRQLKLSIEAMNLFLESEAFSREKATVVE